MTQPADPTQNPNADVTPEPVWDGDGKDPWLPQRVNQLLDAKAAEDKIYASVWEALSSWLVTTSRRILSGPVPQPEAVFAQAPAWQRAVDKVILDAIMPVMSWAYEGMFGPDFPWMERPSVINYLAGVSNRLVGVPDEVFNMVSGQLAAGVTLGEGIPDLSQRVRETLSPADSARWPNRAVRIARTEALGALNGSRNDSFVAFAEESDEELERMWLSTVDGRTRPTHRRADGQRTTMTDPFRVGGADLMFPGDPRGPAKEVIQCVPADTRIEAGSVRAVTRRWFEGEMVRIRFSTGDVLTITPNHPVLRATQLWTPAGLLEEGDYCVAGSFGGYAVGQPYKYAVPPQIGEVYRAASETQAANRVAMSPPDFHGDGMDGDVEVVAVHRDLSLYGQAATDEEIQSFGLSMSDLAALSVGGGEGGTFTFGVPRREVDSLPPALRVRWRGHSAAFVGSHASSAESVGFASAAAGKAEFFESSGDEGSTDPQCPSDGEHTFAVEMALAKVVKVERFIFTGHVFNLDTGVGWYIANGITVRNCRCTVLLVEVGENVDMTDRQLKRR